MAFMWPLMGIVLVAVICTACEIIKGRKRETQRSAVVIHPPRYRPVAVTPSVASGKHTAKRLSMKECESLLRTSDNVIFIAIRAGSSEDFLRFPGINVISIPPNELAEVLHWLPPARKVVLCGQVDLCSATIKLAEVNAGTAQLYVLQSQPAHSVAGRSVESAALYRGAHACGELPAPRR